MALWTADQLAEHLHDPGLVVIDVRQGEAYANGHIPGSRHFSMYGLNTYDTDPAPLKSFVHGWAFLLGRVGVEPASRVVLYEDLSGMTAARGFWFLEYLGHRDVHVLDGGLKAWLDAGHEITQQAELPPMVNYDYNLQPDLVAGYRDILEAIGATDTVILDTRSDEEWFGTRITAQQNGTIPGAVHLEWLHNLTSSGYLRTPDELRAIYEHVGITPEQNVIALCNTGYRSAHAYLALRISGFERVRNYVGSWQEWGNRAGLPVVVPSNNLTAPLLDGE